MKKGKLYISILLGLCLCLFTAFFTACGKEETPPAPTLESISVLGETEVFIDEFDYTDYTITATYSDNSTKTATLTADNLSAEDNAKISTVGTHALTVNYESVSCSWTITLKNHDFAGITFDDITTTYDGTAKTLAVAGLPTGAQVSYDKATSYTNAGEYTVKATVTLANYNPVELTATLTINKAVYDMSTVEFVDKTVTYNGESHSITATNLPNGVTAQYTGNNQINANEYTVTASFTGDSQNYEPIANKMATLTINKATYDMSGVVFKDKSVNYTGEAYSIEATNLPEGVSATYDGNNQTQAGEYTITAHFTGDRANYNAIPNMTATLKINASDLTGISFNDGEFTYDGTKKSIFITGTLPDGVKVEYKNNEQINADSYTVTATFTCTNGNYTNLPELTATLTIKKAVYDMSGVVFADKTITYDGQAHSILATNLPNGVTAEYTGNKQINAGEYEITATFKGDSSNYELIASQTATLTIEQLELTLAFNGETTLKYNGNAQKTITVQATNLVNGDSVELTVSYNGAMIEAGEYIATATLTAHQNYKLTANNTVKVTITRAMHTVTFKQDGVADVTREVLDLADLTDIPTPQHVDGYKFTWNRTDFTSIMEDITVTANKTVITYTIEYVLQYGKNPTENPKTYTIESASITLKNPENLFGMQFGGWYTSETFLPSTSVTTVGGGQFGDIKLYGQFIGYRVEEAIGFEIDYSQGTPTISKTVPHAMVEMDLRDSIAISNGCTWQVAGDELGTVIYSRKIIPLATGENVFYLSVFHPDGNHDTLYELHIYRLDMKTYTFINGVTGETIYSGEVEENLTIMPPEAQENAGYIYVGWRLNGAEIEFPYTVIEDTTIVATYEAKENTLYFDGNGATDLSMSEMKIHTDETVTLNVNAFTRLGYRFLGWATSADGEVLYHDGANYTMGTNAEYTLYAVWGCLYEIDNGTITALTEYGTDITELVIPDSIDGVSIIAIAESTFNGNLQLTSVVIPNSVSFIGKSAFAGCNNLASITLPFVGESKEATSYNSVFGYIFGYETNTSTAVNGVTYQYNDNGVYYYYNVPASVKTIVVTNTTELPKNAFLRRRTIENVTLMGVEIINSGAFEECESLKYVEIGDKVTSIGLGAFYKCASLQEINFPNTLTEIGEKSFKYCSSLTSIKIPDSVTVIGNGAFEECNKVESLSIGKNVSQIDIKAFYKCNMLTKFEYGATECTVSSSSFEYIGCNGDGVELTIRANVKSIPDYFLSSSTNKIVAVVFEDESVCESIGTQAFYSGDFARIILPDNILSIGNSAFNWCSKLENIIIPQNVATIGERAFSNCSGLLEIQYNATKLTDMTSSVFSGCENVKTVVIGKTVKIIPSHLFASITSITSIIFEEESSCQSIGESAFSGCTGLTEIIIPDGVTSIGASAFSGCTGLTEIIILDGVISMGDSVFYACNNLTIYCEVERKPSGWNSNWNKSNQYVIWGYAGEKGVTEDGFIWALIKPNTMFIIGYIGNVTKLTIPTTINGYPISTIGEEAFYDYNSLVSIEIPDSVTFIGYKAFYNCDSLTEITLPFVGETKGGTSNTHLGYIFGASSYSYNNSYLPSSLKSVIITSAISIGEYAFYDCDSLTSIVIPDSVTSIGYDAFSGCSGLTSIEIPDSVTSIASYAFSGCSGLTSIEIPDSVTSIGSSAFSGCSSLTSIEIPDSVTSIGYEAFYNCSKLTIYCEAASQPSGWSSSWNYSNRPVVWNCNNNDMASDGYIYVVVDNIRYSIKDGVATVVWQASNIQTANISANITHKGTAYNVTSIGYEAFYNCSSLTSVVIPDSVTSIGYDAFSGCSSLTSIEIPNGVTSIGDGAFSYCSSLTSIEIPDSVTSIGYEAFSGCSSLESITIPFVGGSRKTATDTYQDPFGYIFGTSSYTGGTATTQYYYGSSTSSTTDSTYYIPTSLKSVMVTGGNILYGAFYNCRSLTSVVIGDGVTSIGGGAFYNCRSLTSVVIGDGVTSIGGGAFRYCSSLTSVVIPDSVTYIGDSAFYNCSSLTIYCEATSKPSRWSSSWNYYRPVVWGAVSQTYQFESNGGSAVERKETTVLTNLPTPTKDGWYFGGWYDNADLTGSPVTSPYYSKTKTTLYAKWLTEEEYIYIAYCDGSSFERAIQAEVGGSYAVTIDTADEKVYYKFTATESKSYTIKSSGGLDTYGYLYDSSQSQLTYNDGTTDFTITRSLTAGETYYIVVKMYSSSETGTFTLTIS